jgi:hypothetical protein
MPSGAIAVNLCEANPFGSTMKKDAKPNKEKPKAQSPKDRPKEYINGREVEYVEPEEVQEVVQTSRSVRSKD